MGTVCVGEDYQVCCKAKSSAQKETIVEGFMLNLRCSMAVAVLVLTFLTSPCWAADPTDDGEWLQLFNGKDLTGWTPKITGYAAGDNYADTFRVQGGVLRVSS